MKNWKYIVLSIGIGCTVFSCSSAEWSKKDKDALKKRCLQEGGSRSYCKCYLKNAMKVYDNADEMKDISFEEAVELSLNCD